MNKPIRKAGLWIACTIGGVLLIYAAIFTISVLPAIILSPFIVFEAVKEGGWSEISLYYKLIIVCGSLIFAGIVIKVLWPLIKWIKERIASSFMSFIKQSRADKNYFVRVVVLLWFLFLGFLVYMIFIDTFVGNPLRNYLSKGSPKNIIKSGEQPTQCVNLPRGYSESDCILDNTETPGQYDNLPDW